MTARTLLALVLAAICEIAGCYSAWMWLRLGRSPLWLLPGAGLLILFALSLTQIEATYAGRAYAAYGGVYIVASLAWGKLVEHRAPGLGDVAGALLCLLGAGIILLGATNGR